MQVAVSNNIQTSQPTDASITAWVDAMQEQCRSAIAMGDRIKNALKKKSKELAFTELQRKTVLQRNKRIKMPAHVGKG